MYVLLDVFHLEPSEGAMGTGAVDTNAALVVFPKLAAQGTMGIAGLHCDFLLTSVGW